MDLCGSFDHICPVDTQSLQNITKRKSRIVCTENENKFNFKLNFFIVSDCTIR